MVNSYSQATTLQILLASESLYTKFIIILDEINGIRYSQSELDNGNLTAIQLVNYLRISYLQKNFHTLKKTLIIQGHLAHYKPGDAQDVQAMLRDLLGDTLQEMLEAEMDEHLGYSK